MQRVVPPYAIRSKRSSAQERITTLETHHQQFTLDGRNLSQYNCWHTCFQVQQDNWAFVWEPTNDPEHDRSRVRIPAGFIWSPRWQQFLEPNSLPGTQRWVPTAHFGDGECHFVVQAPAGTAHVLLDRPFSFEPTVCHHIDPAFAPAHIPEGWRLRPDLSARGTRVTPRTGDILVPALRPSSYAGRAGFRFNMFQYRS